LLPPANVSVELDDSTAYLRWQVADSLLHTAFVVERSDDGGISFRPTQTTPLLPAATPDSLGRYWGVKAERLPRFYQNYFYRLKALTPFGQLSPSSARVQGYLTRLPLPTVSARPTPKNQMLLQWQFADSLQRHIRGFVVKRSAKLGQAYQIITPKPLSPKQRVFLDTLPLAEAYYQVEVLNWAYKPLPSYPALAQIDDATGPAKPRWKKPVVHPNGTVKLAWKANAEPDLLGYRLYRGNHPRQEFSLIKAKLSPDTTYQDTLSLKLLNKTVYYALVAYDNRLNASLAADTLVVMRPDSIPPAAPSFTHFITSDTSIVLQWVNSPSADCDTTLLLRQLAADTTQAPQRLLAFAPAQALTTFTDTTALEKQTYRYLLLAQDKAGLRSAPAKITLQRLWTAVRKPIWPLRVERDSLQNQLRIGWPTPTRAVKKYVLYRQKGTQEKMALYQIFEGKNGAFIETDLQPKTTYRYRLSALFDDDSQSQVSPTYTFTNNK